MIQREKKRILSKNIAPINRLFDLGSAEIFRNPNILMTSSGSRRLGQQDCKDFFICLSENKEHWFDVYKLFMVESVTFTTCTNCHYISNQDNAMSGSTFFHFECPAENISMSTFIEAKLNTYEIREDWKDEDGCKRTTIGRNSLRIKDINETENLIFVIDRLMIIDGNLQIVTNRVPLGKEVLLQDVEGKKATFTPIAVIHHNGGVINNITQGHYQADILDKKSDKWIRTSDDEDPVIISKDNITKAGYIFLYKKVG